MSGWDNALEPLLRSRDGGRGEGEGRALALRLGLRQVEGFREDWAKRLVAARKEGLFSTMEDLARRAGLPARALRMLADEIGRASCRERVWQYVEISVVAVSFKKRKTSRKHQN